MAAWIYAEHGVRELWVIDAARGEVHVHLGAGPGGYAWTSVRVASERLEPQHAPRAFAFALDELEAIRADAIRLRWRAALAI